MNKTKCPRCGSENTHKKLKLLDEFLTKEEFEIEKCHDCGLLFTSPRPPVEKIGAYYKSDKYYSHQENKTGLIPLLYESVKRINLRNKARMATQGKDAGRLLDIGCGVGSFVQILESKGWDCTAVEPSEEAKAIAQRRIKAQILQSADLEKLPDASFDVITMWHVLEHVDDLRWQIAQLQRLIKPLGRIVIAVPNYKSNDGQYYKEKWAAYDVPRHLYHFDSQTIQRLFWDKTIHLNKTQHLEWDAYYISYLSEVYLNHPFPLLKGAFRGIVSNLKALRSREWSSLVYIFEKKP